ncbi:hypothetical protein [Burkholderia gladioli]|uniref:hypothetical protein n=1 Tax=Burkholderia gladioli TaxID=28095 RepID=UPI001C21C6CD|nr:hypothetical protein [Burkholderia gladioli]MBU9175904.1 hypothetical protein [Burkholderia gladioli]
MEQAYPAEGFFDLTALDLFQLACQQYEQFYHEQTPINAYLVSVTLLHLLDWLAKDGSADRGKKTIEAKEAKDRSVEEALVLKIYELEDFQAVISAANNAKHRELNNKNRPAYTKRRRQGAFAGVTRAGDSLGTEFLILDVAGKEIWLRDAFGQVLDLYRMHFTPPTST